MPVAQDRDTAAGTAGSTRYRAAVDDKSRGQPADEQLLRVTVHREPSAIVVVVQGEVDMLTVDRLVVDDTRAVIRPIQLSGLEDVLALYYSVDDALPR